MKTVKSKIVTGVVAVGLLSGVGAAFANSDAGSALKNWYYGEFAKSQSEIETATVNYATEQGVEAITDYSKMRHDAAQQIKATQNEEVGATIGEIDATTDAHIDSLTKQKEKIMKFVDNEFNQVVKGYSKDASDITDIVYGMAVDDMTQHTADKGARQLKQLEKEINTYKEASVEDLVEAVEQAKDEIGQKLTQEEELAITEIQAIIDEKLAKLETKVAKLTAELVAAQEKTLRDTAALLEDQAKSELDAIVDGI